MVCLNLLTIYRSHALNTSAHSTSSGINMIRFTARLAVIGAAVKRSGCGVKLYFGRRRRLARPSNSCSFFREILRSCYKMESLFSWDSMIGWLGRELDTCPNQNSQYLDVAMNLLQTVDILVSCRPKSCTWLVIRHWQLTSRFGTAECT